MNKEYVGPTLPISKEIHASKYRSEGEPFLDSVYRFSSTLSDDDKHRHALTDIVGDMRFLPAGRVQAAIGSSRKITPWNCFVSGTIADDFNDIMDKAKEAGHTMRLGGGIGYDFSTLRPRGNLIKSLGSQSSGPVSFMQIYDTICGTIASAGHRRGAQMGVLRVDHPDIEEFIFAKRNDNKLTRFNISVGITDAFMKAVKNGTDFSLKWRGKIYNKVDARTLWDAIMRSTWDWAEPGVLFIDRINQWNNLHYCETISATNPSLRAGTKVITSDGIYPIEELQDKEFLTKNLYGNFSNSKCFLSGKNKELYKITLSSGKEYYCTAEHKWPLITSNGIKKVETTDITIGDRFPILQQDSLFNGNLGSYEDGFVIGWLYGDGWITDVSDTVRQYGFIFGNEDIENGIHERVSNYLTSITGETYKGSLNKNCLEFNIRNKTLDFHFKKFGVDKKEYGLPTAVWRQGSEEFRKGIIDGLFSSDGHIGKVDLNRITLTSKHRKLIEDVQELIGFYGIFSNYVTSTAYNPSFPNGKQYNKDYTRYDLAISRKNSITHFRNLFKLSNVKKQNRLDSFNLNGYGNRSNYNEVIDIVKTDLKEDVWDISVYDSTHCFQLSNCVTGNCGEQPLPPYGACLLGSFNLTKFINKDKEFNYGLFISDIHNVVRAIDNIIDVGIYPLPQQEEEGKSKRRMGLGITGLANTLEYLGYPYGSERFLEQTANILSILRNETYLASSQLAEEKGSFPLFDKDRYLSGKFIKTLPDHIKQSIADKGIRNSHLTSIAPTGTISLAADNISSGIEPVFTYEYNRTIQGFDDVKIETIQDYGYRVWNTKGRTANEVSVQEHVNVLTTAQRYVDSSVSKTCNVGDDVSWDEFKDIYMMAFDNGAKGITTFRAAGKRYGILNEIPKEEKVKEEYVDDEDSVEACYFDPVTGKRTCE